MPAPFEPAPPAPAEPTTAPFDPYVTAPLPSAYGAQPPASPYEAPYQGGYPAAPPYGELPPPSGPPVSPPTDPVSIVALVTSVVGALVASVPLAIIGLVRTSRRRRGGRWAAVLALVLSLVWVAVAGTAFALLGSSSSSGDAASGSVPPTSSAPAFPSDTPTPTPTDTTPTPTPTPTPTVKPAKVVTHKVYIGFVKAGHCFNEPKKGSSFVPELTTCRAPHDEEMMGSVQLGSGRYPGQSAAQSRSDTACQKLFATYVGVPTDDSELGIETWWPSPGLWASGKHIAQCGVYSPDGKTVGSVRGSKR
jgi:hypothetical protein